jgi:hypothetical protein
VARALQDGRPMHGHVVFGLKDGAIGLTDFRYTRAQIGPHRIARLRQIASAIADGTIVPPGSRAALAVFKPVAL